MTIKIEYCHPENIPSESLNAAKDAIEQFFFNNHVSATDAYAAHLAELNGESFSQTDLDAWNEAIKKADPFIGAYETVTVTSA